MASWLQESSHEDVVLFSQFERFWNDYLSSAQHATCSVVFCNQLTSRALCASHLEQTPTPGPGNESIHPEE
jgi:hypothetical protein